MGKAEFVTPKVRLAEIMRKPGGVIVADAVARAERNLDAIKPACRTDMMARLASCDAALKALGETYDEAAVTALYATAVRGIGAGAVCGAPAVDLALTSLCDLITYLQGRELHDPKAIGVHIQACRLLMTSDLPEAARETVLEGLRKVTSQYAPAG